MNHRHELKEALSDDQVTIGTWMTQGHEGVAEVLAQRGFDWITIDREHSSISTSEAERLVRVIELSGTPALVRVTENERAPIKHAMDAGATGVIVPRVSNAAEAREAVDATKYPPDGNRGVGLSRAQDYGMGFEDHRDTINDESIVVVQIEEAEAVSNIDEILSVDGVDAFIVGPFDLSASMGKPGAFEDPEVKEALVEVRKRAREHQAAAGYHVVAPDPEEVQRRVDEGYRFIAFCLDSLFLARMAEDSLSEARELIS